MATSPSKEEQLLKIIKEGVPGKKPSPEEQLLKVIKEGSQVSNAAPNTVAPPAAPAGNLKLKPPQPPPAVQPAKPEAKPSLAGGAAAAGPLVAPKAEPAEPAEQPAASAPPSARGLLKGLAQALVARSALGTHGLAAFWRIEVINRLLALVFVLLLGGFIYFVGLGKPNLEKTASHFPRPPARSAKDTEHEAFLTSGEYVEMTKKRDIFNREPRAAVEGPVVADKPAEQQNKANLQLVGIYFSEAPEVIIEDKVKKKTYFLKEGDHFEGIKVKSIRQDRVILESGGAEWELM